MHVVLIPGELINLQFLSHNLEPETLGSRSRSLNTRIIAKNKKNFEPRNQLFGSADDVMQKTQNLL